MSDQSSLTLFWSVFFYGGLLACAYTFFTALKRKDYVNATLPFLFYLPALLFASKYMFSVMYAYPITVTTRQLVEQGWPLFQFASSVGWLPVVGYVVALYLAGFVGKRVRARREQRRTNAA